MRAYRREQGKPAAALAIIATIFATAFVIKLLPPAARDALLPATNRTLPSRAIQIWSANHDAISAVAAQPPQPTVTVRERNVMMTSAGPSPVEATAEVRLTFDSDPGEAPAIPAATLMPVALPTVVMPVPAEIATGNSPLVLAFSKTRSALRLAFVKTGNAVKTLSP